ncbi:transglutaminase TgpA family protein [Paenibacillus xerothermodurans]|uniref:DUF4129 domain-containing protein n=1 Tax=Paenibacillus xerothermodurans TaxID=1977292 RepID=A0A2W1P531_PAEXE|nr:transglutaminase domain-containing protein [Paenibacillus xerothermodurans]PZE22762.1 DUF4129 domain-containing protein [Paenibacillus xerothermodurans]
MRQTIAWWSGWLWRDWSQRMSALLAGVVLLQFVLWIAKEDGVWLPETVLIVELTLLATIVLEYLLRVHWLIRGVLHLIAIIGINARVLIAHHVIDDITLTSFFSSQLFHNMYQLTPYLWFSFSVWIVYFFVVWWVAKKWRIYSLMIVSVLAMCIRDSFSQVYLWPQVAVTVGCGLFLLILVHFQQLRKKAPAAWRSLSDYPASIALPVISLICLTLSIGAVMPEVNPVLTDPYTAWRNLRGEHVNFTTGKGIEIAAPSAFTDASSGYSRNDSALGGSFEFDYTPIMTVDTSYRSYWRGETRALYNGKGWEPSDSDKRPTVTRVRANAVLPSDPQTSGSQLKTMEVRQTVTLLSNEKYPVLFAAMNAQKVVDLNGGTNGFESLFWAPAQSELRVISHRAAAYPKSYTLVSQLPIIDEAGLRKAPFVPPNRAEFAQYLQLPDSTPARVRQLALEITQTSANPYDKAKAIEQFLRDNYPYTNKPDLSKGKSRDFVDRFLFEIGEGYCDYYSTAMAVLARANGLPARWVKGYASGSSAQKEDAAAFDHGDIIDPDAAGVYTVRNADAHSWVEVYFNGWGWIPFEPTSGFSLPRAPMQEESIAQTEATPSAPETAAEMPVTDESGSTVARAAGVTVLFAALAAFLSWRFEVVELIRERMERRRASLLKQKVIIECERMLRICRGKGYVRMEHETMREAVARWTKQSKWLTADLEHVLSIFEKAKYSQAEITEEDWRNTAKLVEKLRSQF